MRSVLLTIILACAGLYAYAKGATNEPRKAPYVHCNVTLADACFGIAPGDKLTMEVVIDFVLYNIEFPSGRTALVYYGFSPKPSEDEAGEFEKCPSRNGFANCQQRALSNGGIEFIAARDAKSEMVHVLVSGGTSGQEDINSFLQNFRACRQVGRAITCAP